MSRKHEGAIRKYFLPTLVLVVICAVVTGALAVTHGVTAPVILEQQALAEQQAISEVLGDTQGEAIKVKVKSYGGYMEVMVGITEDGAVAGVKVLSHADTPGLGTKAMTPEYLSQYQALTDLPGAHIKEDDQVDAITGATISSNAIYQAVREALSEFHQGKEGQE